MKLAEAIAEMEKNLVRYRHEANTGMRHKNGKPTGNVMSERDILRRKKSIPGIEERLAIVRRWLRAKHRADSPLFPAEQLVIEMYELDIHEITAPVLP